MGALANDRRETLQGLLYVQNAKEIGPCVEGQLPKNEYSIILMWHISEGTGHDGENRLAINMKTWGSMPGWQRPLHPAAEGAGAIGSR